MRFLEFKPLNENIGTLEIPVPGPYRSKIVSAMQKALAALNYDVHDTSIVDERTMKAIAAAQQNFGLTVTGKPDSNFISALNMSIPSIPGLSDYIANAMKSAKSDSDNLAGAPASNVASSTPPANNIVSNIPVTNQHDTEKIKPVKSTSALATDSKFLAKVDEVASKLGVDPNILMKIMQHESGLKPTAINDNGCVGLIQFCHDDTVGIPRSTIRKMDAISQMDLVYKYYKKVGVQPGMTQGEIYMLTFVPWAKNKDRNTVIGQKGGGRLAPNINISKNELWKDNPTFAKWAAAQGRDYYTKGDVIDYFKHYQA